MGLAEGYKWITIAPFIRSLRKTGYQGAIVLFVGKQSRFAIPQLAEYRVTTIPIQAAYPWGLTSSGLMQNAAHLDSSPPHIRRYGMYRLYLEIASYKYDSVMLTDTKDVLFQRDPFSYDAGGARISFFEEDSSLPLKECPTNREWIADFLDQEEIGRIADCPVICSGTTIGVTAAVTEYCDRMLACMGAHGTKCIGGDQGAHNYLIRKHGFLGMKVFSNESGPVMTLASRRPEFVFNSKGQLLNASGQVPNVIHQYDRFASLQRRLCRPYLSAFQRIWLRLAQARRGSFSVIG